MTKSTSFLIIIVAGCTFLPGSASAGSSFGPSNTIPPPSIYAKVEIAATPSTITAGESTFVQWATNWTTHDCTATFAYTPFGDGIAGGGTATEYPTRTKTYTVTCLTEIQTDGSVGGTRSISASATVQVSAAQQCTSAPNACGQTQTGTCPQSPPPNPAGYGNSCTSAPNACGMTAAGTMQCNGTCSAARPSDSLCPVPSVDLYGPTSVVSGNSATLSWTSANVTSCVNAAGEGTGSFSAGGATSGSDSVGTLTTPPASYSYQVRCTGPYGTANDTHVINVSQPTAYITATPKRVNQSGNNQTIVSWSASLITANCRVTGTDGYASAVLSGPSIATTSVTRSITRQTIYTISCDNGAVVRTVIVNVLPSFDEF